MEKQNDVKFYQTIFLFFLSASVSTASILLGLCFMGAVTAQGPYGGPDFYMGGFSGMMYDPYMANYQPPTAAATSNRLTSQCSYFCYRPCPMSFEVESNVKGTKFENEGGLLICSPSNTCPSTNPSGAAGSSLLSVKRPTCPTYICLVDDPEKACTVSECKVLSP